MEQNNNKVYLKDGEGSSYAVAEHHVEGNKYFLYTKFIPPKELFPRLEEYQVRPGDTWLLTYHKAGTHWVYEIMGVLLCGELKPLPDTKIVGFVEFTPSAMFQEAPGLYSAHMNEKYLPKCIFEKGKSVVVVRNPKSVATSAYHFCVDRPAMEYSGTFNGFLSEFNRIGAFGEYCGTWCDYYLPLWKKHKDNPNVLFVFFEDLKKDTVPQIKRIADFLGVDRDLAFCEGVAELSSFDKMKQYTGKKEKSALTLHRKGTIDDWKNKFTVQQNEEFDKEWEEKMSECPDLRDLIQFS